MKFAIALFASLIRANTQDDDLKGIFGKEIRWKTGYA